MNTVFLVILCVVYRVISDPSCPHYCECKWRNGLPTADCAEKNINRVPVTTDTMQAIIMDKNNLTQLAPFEFYNANWAEVRKISLRYCHISSFNKTNNHSCLTYSSRHLILDIFSQICKNGIAMIRPHPS